MEININDFWQDQLKMSSSYLGKIPSEILNEEQYSMFLDIASSEELENDIITRETLHKIIPPDYSNWQCFKSTTHENNEHL